MQRKPSTGWQQSIPMRSQSSLKVGTVHGCRQIRSEERLKSSEERLIRPIGRLRLETSLNLLGQKNPHKMSDSDVFLRCDLRGILKQSFGQRD